MIRNSATRKPSICGAEASSSGTAPTTSDIAARSPSPVKIDTASETSRNSEAQKDVRRNFLRQYHRRRREITSSSASSDSAP